MRKLSLVDPSRSLSDFRSSHDGGDGPAPSLKPSSSKIRTAKAMASRLFDLLPQLDVADPEFFIAAAVAILAEYPADVMLAAIDPVHGIPSRTDRPTLRLIKAACEESYAPIQREEDRARAAEQSLLSRPLPRAPRTPEQQAAVDAQVEATRRELGIPAGGLPKRGIQGRPISERPTKQSVLADLEARRARNEAKESVLADLEARRARNEQKKGNVERAMSIARMAASTSRESVTVSKVVEVGGIDLSWTRLQNRASPEKKRPTSR